MLTKAEYLTHLPRWIFASCDVHFQGAIDQTALKMFPEGYSKSEEERQMSRFCEFRMDGPNIFPQTKNQSKAKFDINILIQTTMQDSNFHVPLVDIGLVLAAFTTIPIYRYGEGILDDQSLIGCATITTQGRETAILVSQFGEIETNLKLSQATVETTYSLDLKTI